MPRSRSRLLRAVRAVLLVMATATAWLAVVTTPADARGEIVFKSCVTSNPGNICVPLPHKALDNAAGVAVSPNGKSVYVVSSVADTITLFNRNAAGEVSFGRGGSGCFVSEPILGCTDLPGNPIDGARAVATSADGKSVYVSGGQTLAMFSRNEINGRLTFLGCFGAVDRGCTQIPNSIGNSFGIAVSPDGKSVYVTSPNANSVTHFFRDASTGQLSYDGCVASKGFAGCTDAGGPGLEPLDGALGVTVSPDNKSVYVASGNSDSIAHFIRNSTGAGQIAYDGCTADAGKNGCTAVPDGVLDFADGVAVSPDNRNVYVTSNRRVAQFSRSTADEGRIEFVNCLGNGNDPLCFRVPAVPAFPFLGANAIVVSPDGTSIYVTSAGGTVTHLSRNENGFMFFRSCLTGDDDDRIACSTISGNPFAGPTGVAVSPDGTSVYMVAFSSSSITHLSHTP